MEQESSNTAVKIVAIIGGVIIVIVISCGVLGYFLIRQGSQAFKETVGKAFEAAEAIGEGQSVADTFLTSIQTNDLEGAYQSTSEAFKKRMPRKEFDDLVKKHPALKEPATNIGLDAGSPRNSSTPFPMPYKYQYHAQSKDGKDSIEFTVTVNREGGTMKVDQFTIKKALASDEGPDQP
jgi:hypothetical protein